MLDVIALHYDGLPHSDTPGSKLAYSYPRIFAVNRVLHRLLVPRHPPHALFTSRLSFLSLIASLYVLVNDRKNLYKSGEF